MPLLDIAAPAFRAKFGRAPFLVQHRLAAHSLFALPRLVALARELPAASVEWNAGKVPISLDPAHTPRNGLSPEETIRRIEECSSWLVLKNVERDPAYAALLRACLGEVGVVAPQLTEGMHGHESFIFISSPGAVTPYHMDPEENFLLQIRGRKTMRIFDRAVVSAAELERFHKGAHRNLTYRDEYAARAQAYNLMPGLGVHVPVTAPHWVQNGPEVSISYSITFRTKASARAAHAHQMNGWLRTLGFDTSPVGESVLKDRMKQLALKIKRARPLAAPFLLRTASSGDRS
jgi:hypothetical protein